MLTGKKTYIVALGTILTAVGMYLHGDYSVGQAAHMAADALMAIFIRNGINTVVQAGGQG